VVAVVSAAGCESEPLFVSCNFDYDVNVSKICTGGAGNSSCVVPDHPQCAKAICLSYYGKGPFCTQSCQKNADCPGDAFCWLFDTNKKTSYCVKREMEVKSTK
jgi:hypothetical protein